MLKEAQKQLFPPQLASMRAWLGLPADAPAWPKNLGVYSEAFGDAPIDAGCAAFEASIKAAEARVDTPPCEACLSFSSVSEDFKGLLRMLEGRLEFCFTPNPVSMLGSVEHRITEWRMTAGAAKSTMLLCALRLAVSMQPGGIGLFLTKSHKMAQDAYALAQRIFGESDVLLLSAEPKADGSWANHAYEYFKQKAMILSSCRTKG